MKAWVGGLCLLTWAFVVGAGDENRTRVASLEDWGSTIELHPRVGVPDDPPSEPRGYRAIRRAVLLHRPGTLVRFY